MTRTMTSMGALALLLAFTNEARAQNETNETNEPRAADVPRPPVKRAIGEAGDVVLEDVLGARSQSPFGTAVLPPAQAGAGGLGAIGSVGLVSGPNVTAAWFSYSSTSTGPDDRVATKLTRWSFAPSADIFIARGISIGGLVGYARSRMHVPGFTKSLDTNAFAIHPRIGYVVPITADVAVWPRIHGGVTAHYAALDQPAAQQYRAAVDVPLAIRVSSHLLVDVGPEAAYTVLESQGITQRSFTFAGRGGISLVF